MSRRILKHLGFLSLAIVLLIPLYVMSYAPFVRCCETIGVSNRPEFFYKPVHYLIDETPLQDMYFKWAEFCGVENQIFPMPIPVKHFIATKAITFIVLQTDIEKIASTAEMEEGSE